MITKYSKPKTLPQRITEFFTTSVDVIRNVARTYTRRFRGIWRPPVDDWGRADYAFWRRAARAQVKGLELSGLFIKPVVNKIAGWSMTPPPEYKCNNETGQILLNQWMTNARAAVLMWIVTSLKVGDSFLVINPDLTCTLVAADNVDPIVDPLDYSVRVGWRITQVLEHPEQANRMVITDEYYADRRVHRKEVDGLPVELVTYPNLIGMIPVIHLANTPDEGQTFGWPEASSALNLLYRYNDVLLAGVDGNLLQGRPTPVAKFETEADLDKYWELYGEDDTTVLPDGTTITEPILNVDLSELMTLSGGDFTFAQPGSFIGDTEKLLGLMFYLLLEHWEMPEFVFGNAIASSQASAETQMPIWATYIQGRQQEFSQALIHLATVVLAFLSLTNPGVVAETPSVQFKDLIGADGALTLETLKWLFLEGLIDRRTALMLAPVDVENIDEVLDAAQKERDERDAKELAQTDALSDQAADNNRNREIARLESEGE